MLHHSAWWFASGISGLVTMNAVVLVLGEGSDDLRRVRKCLSLAMVVPYFIWGVQNSLLADFENSKMWSFEKESKGLARWVPIFYWSLIGCCGTTM